MSLQKNIRLLSLFNFFTDFRLYSPIAIIYFSRISHSYALGASIFSIIFITSAIFDIPCGIFADRIGRKKTMILGAAAAVMFTILYAIGINFWILALGAVFEGLSRAFYSGNNNALLHNMLSDEGMEHDYHMYLGKLSSMFQIALAISGLLGSIIATWSFPLIMWLSVIPQLICFGISFQISNSKKITDRTGSMLDDLKEGIRGFIHNANLRLLSLSSILSYSFGESSYQFQAAFYNTLLPIWAVGLAKTLNNIIAAFGFHFSGKIINKFGALQTLFFGEIYSKIIGFIALIFATKISPFLIASDSFFFGTGSTAANSLMQKEFTDKQRATMSSLNSFAGSILFSIIVFITGLFADKLGPRNALLIIQLLSLSAIWFMWRLYNLSKKII